MRILACLFLLAFCCSASAAQPYNLHSVTLLQPQSIVSERVQPVEKLASYIDRVDEAASRSLAHSPAKPTSGYIAIAVRPGRVSKAWLDLSPALPRPLEARVTAAIEAVRPFAAKRGVVIFALNVILWGAPPTKQQWPRPAMWLRAVKKAGHSLTIDEVVNRVWPPAPGT